MRCKAIATDLDGTLADGFGQVSDFAKLILKRCQEIGIKVFYVTARRMEYMEQCLDGFTPDGYACGYGKVIVIGGEVVYDKLWYELEDDPLPGEPEKFEAIKLFSKHMNISVEDFVVFGDEEPDILMIEKSGFGVAVSNAIPEVIEVADDICPFSNYEDAVAKWIVANILS